MDKIRKHKNKVMDNFDTLEPSFICMYTNERLFSIISSNDNCQLLQDIKFYLHQLKLVFPKFVDDNIKNPKELEKEIDKNNQNKLCEELIKIIVDENLNGSAEYINIKNNLSSHMVDFTFTRDNFIKMVFLFLRIRAGISTIIMGETGCGKTYLIKMFTGIYSLNHESLFIKSFHSGTTDDEIIEFIKLKILEYKILQEKIIKEYKSNFELSKNNDLKKFEEAEQKRLGFFERFYKTYIGSFDFKDEYNKYNKSVKSDIENKIKNRKIILFFDEINTSKSLGTIKRIICDRNFRKKIGLPDNFVIICACNPYRGLSDSNQNLQFGLTMKNSKKRDLVYTVNPLPYSLLNFVLYFNDLSGETTLKYIQKMNETIKCKISLKTRELINKLVYKSHFFMTKKGDISSVSLREIQRFSKFFKFFFEKYFKEYKKLELESNELEIKVIVLSLYLCYYLRLPNTKLRLNYINEIIKDDIPYFENICKKETEFITEKVLEGRIGFAKNKGLCENIFSEFICVLLKEPLIICGKPGSSKSLSVRLLLNGMKGKKSKIEFFKQFPEVIPSFYQCSLTSTSENLEKVFINSKNRLEKNKDNKYNMISLIFMDELGIADESANNPLKLLHSLMDDNSLEKDENKKFAFIGISNWTLDASKMNRAINIVVEEPDLYYIEETAKEIARNININLLIKYENIIKPISQTYLDYLEEQKKRNKEDFHGFRDFYYLINGIFYNISEDNNMDDFMDCIFKSIYRNFGGYDNSAEMFIDRFLLNYNYQKLYGKCQIKSLIKDNIESPIDSRYLLLIVKNDIISETFLKYILKEKDYEIISNKNIKKYDNENNAILNLLLEIEILMKSEITLILKDLEIIYPSLYELFNKNFYEYGTGNKFVQISYENSHSLVQVNPKFRVIVLVNEDKLNEEEIPFLNRFEKQMFMPEKFLKKDEIEKINKYFAYAEKLKKELDFINLDYIYKDLFDFFIVKTSEKEGESLKYFFRNLISLFPQEMIYCLNNDLEKEKFLDTKTIKDINYIYEDFYNHNYNFKMFLSNLKSNKNVIYTYSNIHDNLLNKNEEIENLYLQKKFRNEKMKIIEINKDSIKDKKIILTFLDKNEYDLFIIKIDEEIFLNDKENIYFENLWYEMDKTFKMIDKRDNKNNILLYIIYKKRNQKRYNINQINIFRLFLIYNQIFIDNLNNMFKKEEKMDLFHKNLIKGMEKILEDKEIMINIVLEEAFKLIKLKIQNEKGYNF